MRASADVVDLKLRYSVGMAHSDSSMFVDLKAGAEVQSHASHLVSLHLMKIVLTLFHYLPRDPAPEEIIPLMVMACPAYLDVSVYSVNEVHSISQTS